MFLFLILTILNITHFKKKNETTELLIFNKYFFKGVEKDLSFTVQENKASAFFFPARRSHFVRMN